MLTAFYQRLVCPLMLVLASLGSAPLWLHDALCHHSECCDSRPSDGFDSNQCPSVDSKQCPGCCDAADESTLASQLADCRVATEGEFCLPSLLVAEKRNDNESAQHLEISPQFLAGSHGCLVCYQLSQPQTVILRAVSYSSERLFFTCRTLSVEIAVATVEGPPPARGPPSFV